MLLPFTLKRFERVRDWGIGIGLVSSGTVSFLVEPVVYWTSCLLNQLFIEPVVYWTSCFIFSVAAFFISYKNQKKTACGLYYKYEVSMKSLYYMIPVAEKRWYLSRKNCCEMIPVAEKMKWALFSEEKNFLSIDKFVQSVIW